MEGGVLTSRDMIAHSTLTVSYTLAGGMYFHRLPLIMLSMHALAVYTHTVYFIYLILTAAIMHVVSAYTIN